MPITTTTGCTVVTGNAIRLYRLLALKSSLKLEMIGLRHSRGVNAGNLIRDEIGSKTKNKTKLLEELESYIAKNKEVLTA